MDQQLEMYKNILNHILPIADSDWDAMAAHSIPVQFKAGQKILSPPDCCEFILFINQGTARAFQLVDDEHEMNLLLMAEQEFITDYESLLLQKPATLNIEALEDIKGVSIRYNDLKNVFLESLYWNKLARIMAERIYLSSKRRTEMLLFQSPEERYVTLLDNNPNIFQRFALKHISSYIGVKPQSLSRIRKRLSESIN